MKQNHMRQVKFLLNRDRAADPRAADDRIADPARLRRLGSTIHQALQRRWPLLLVGIALALAVLYRFGPDRQHTKWRWITWGSAMAALPWLAASALFS
jgi:uncharacterized BrkB/YihY/UPF0761 family membrane protein